MRKLNFISKFYIVVFLFSIISIGKSQEDPLIDSLKKALVASKDTSRLLTLSYLIENLPNENDWIDYNKEMGALSIDLFKKTKDPILKIRIAKYIGDYFNGLAYLDQVKANHKEALINYEKGLKIKKILGDKAGVSVTLANMGTLYGDESNHTLALDYLYESLRISEEIKYDDGTVSTLNNIANIFLEQKQNTKAIEYFYKALAIAQKIEYVQMEAGIYNNMGVAFDNLQRFDSSITYYDKCLAIIKPMQVYQGVSSIYNNIASSNIYKKNYAIALTAIDSSIKYSKLVGLTTGLAACYHNRAQIYYETGKYNEALTNAKIEEKLAKESGSPKLISDAALISYRLNKITGNFKEAVAYHETYMLMKDSLVSENNKKATISKQFKYAYEKKAATDSLRTLNEQKIKNLKHEEEISKQRTYTYGGIVGFLLMMLVAIVAVKAYKQKQKANEIITAQKNEVEKQKSIIQEQKELVEEHQKEIIDSIRYAKRIQQALLPTQKYIAKSIERLKK